MFFPLMNQEEKEKCLSLLVHAAKCDNELHENEQKLIDGYSLLMGVNAGGIEENFDGIMDFFSTRSEKIQRAVFLETLGLVLSDSAYHHAEEKLIAKIATCFSLDSDYINSSKTWIEEFLPLYLKGFELVGVKR
jgi:hypothetical protein